MKKLHPISCFALCALIASPIFADSNATGGGITNSETVFLGAGPFDHGDTVGNADNTIVAGVAFTGGFSATHVRFAGTLDSVIGATFAIEANIQIRDGGFSSFNWQNPGGATFTSFDYDSSQELTGALAGVDPGAFSWDVEFFESFSDGAGADSQSSNVSMTFEEVAAVSDTNGVFSLGSLGVGDSAASVGEFGVASLFDTYTITLTEAGNLTVGTDVDPTGFVGGTVDTEIAIFDSIGNLLIQDDDDGPGLYSFAKISLAAGDYTVAVIPFSAGTSFDDGFVINPGTGTGDYSISATMTAIPEPGALGILAAVYGIGFVRRRRS